MDAGGVLLDETVVRGRLDLAAIFGNARPVEIEIGSGKGTFLLARAAARPEVNFLGIEWARPYCHYAADRLRRAGLTNARMIRADANEFFRTCLPERSIWRMHIYFPDPWPKRRHHGRRLIQPAFLKLAQRALKIGGQLIIVTDHLDYFRHIQRVMLEVKGFSPVPLPQMSEEAGELAGTNFERKYITQGRPFYSTTLMRHR